MPTTFIKGDILDTPGLHAFAFGSNIDGSMDAGFAIALKKRWPELAEAYAEHCADGKFALGDVFVWQYANSTVFALGIHKGENKPRMPALANALAKLIDVAIEHKVARVGLPRLATSANGLDWTRVRKMLGEISVKRKVRLEVFEQFVRANKNAQ